MQEERKSWRETLADRFSLWWGTVPALYPCSWQTSAPTPPCPVLLGGGQPMYSSLQVFFTEHFCQQQLSDCLNSSNIAWPQHFWSATQLLLETGSMETNEEAVSVLVCWWRTESTSLNSSLASFQRNGSVKADGSFGPGIRHFLGFTGGSAVTQGDGFVPSLLLPGEV